jgi:hypothetical protein
MLRGPGTLRHLAISLIVSFLYVVGAVFARPVVLQKIAAAGGLLAAVSGLLVLMAGPWSTLVLIVMMLGSITTAAVALVIGSMDGGFTVSVTAGVVGVFGPVVGLQLWNVAAAISQVWGGTSESGAA